MHALRLLRATVAAAAIVSAGWLGVINTAAYADPPGGTTCQTQSTYSAGCVVQVQQPVNPSDPNNPNQPVGSTGDTGPACYFNPNPQNLGGQGHTVPCSSTYGTWSNSYNCYVKRLTPQPDASDPAWQGHQPGDGAIYSCYQPQTDMVVNIWAGSPPAGPGAGPTPEQVAQTAIKSMNLTAINAGITPNPIETNPGSMGLVGMPVYLWVKNPTPNTYGPLTASASAGTITVTAKAAVEKIEWDMGDGNTVTCEGDDAKGTPYTAAYGRQPSPTCGYTYPKTSGGQPNNAYTVTARSYWRVDWSGAGQSGTIRLPALEQTVHVRIGEAQVLEQH